jgi:hypothetical protein
MVAGVVESAALRPAAHLVVVHYLLEVPPGWKFGELRRPRFKARINVLTTDGAAVNVDVPLPEVPVGSEREA